MPTNLERTLEGMPPLIAIAFIAWLARKPLCVIELAEEYPPMSRIWWDGVEHYVIGYCEVGDHDHAHLVISAVDPMADHDEAVRVATNLCPGLINIVKEAN